MEYKGISLTLDLDTKNFESALKKIKYSSQQLDTQLKQLRKAFQLDPKNIDTYVSYVATLRNKMQDVQNQSEKLKEVLQEGLDTGKIDIFSEKWSSLNLRILELNKTYNDLENELVEVDNQFKGVNDDLENTTENAPKAADGFTTLKGALANLASRAMIAAFQELKQAIKGVMDYGMQSEVLVSNLRALYGSMATEEDLKNLTDLASELGKTTTYSSNQVLEAMKTMALAGYTAEQTQDSIRAILNSAVATSEDVSLISSIVVDGLNAFGYGTDQAKRYIEVLTVAANETNVDISDLAESFKYSAATAGDFGYDVEDVAAVLAIMGENFIKGSQAGTALRAMLSNISTDTNDARKKLERYIGSVVDAQGNLLPLNDIINRMRESLVDLSDTERSTLFKAVAGQRGQTALSAIIKANADEWDRLTIAIANADGVSQDLATTMQDNLSGDLSHLQGSMQDLGNTIYEKVQDPLRELIQTIQEWVESEDFQDFVDNLAQLIGDVLKSIADFISSGEGKKFLDGLSETFDTIVDIVKALGWLSDALSDSNPLIKGIKNAIWLLEKLVSLYTYVRDFNKVDVSDYVVSNGKIASSGFSGALNSGGFSSGGITLNASFNITNGSNIDRNTVLQWADVMTERINENLGAQI